MGLNATILRQVLRGKMPAEEARAKIYKLSGATRTSLGR